MKLIVFLAMGCAGGLPQSESAAKRVIIVSVDAFRPEFYLGDGWETPNLRAWVKRGVAAKGVESVFPSSTYPAHATIVTGVRPSRHGIVANSKFTEEGPSSDWFWESEHIKARTLWQAAREKGLKTAVMLWPSSVGAEVDWRVPERWAVREGEKTSELLARLSTKGLVAELALGVGLPKLLDTREREGMDRYISDCAAYLIRKHQPNLMFVHMGEVDHLSHREGPNSAAVKAAVQATDGYLAKIWKAVEDGKIVDETVLIVTGDHGFAEVSKFIAPNVLLARAGYIDLEQGKVSKWRALAHAGGGAAAVYVKEGVSIQEVCALLERGSEIGGRLAFRVLDEETRRSLGYNGQHPIVLEAQEGFSFSGSLTGEVTGTLTNTRGSHGYLPTRPQMKTGFIAVGSAMKSGFMLEAMRLVDIAPTVARLLGLEMKDVEGRALVEILAD